MIKRQFLLAYLPHLSFTTPLLQTCLMDFIEQFLAIKPETLVARTANNITHTPSPSFLLILVSICLIVVVIFVVFLYGVFLLCRNTTPSVSSSPAESVTLVEGML